VAEGVATRLRELGFALPPPPKAVGSYAPVVVEGELAFVSGQIVVENGRAVHPGLVGRDLTVEAARDLARAATLQALSALGAALGSIDRIRRIVRVAVYVSAVEGFDRSSEVADGATDLLIALFGEEGRPTRVSMAVRALPRNAPVEVELLAGVR